VSDPALSTTLSRRAPSPAHAAILATTQANILTGHVRTHLVLLGVRCPSAARLRVLLDAVVPHVKSAGEHLAEVDVFRRDATPGTPYVNVALSAAGLRLLGAPLPADAAFRAGMKHREAAALGDPPVDRWDRAYRDDLQALVVIGGADPTAVAGAVRAIRRWVPRTDLVVVERGREHRRTSAAGGSAAVEHFGYVDGVSQPLFIEEEREPGPGWHPETVLGDVLVPEPRPAGEPATYGSYLILRKLEQDTAAFARREEALASALGLTGTRRREAGARLVGRHRDGTPLVDHEHPLGGGAAANTFDHGADPVGDRCPVFAHTRKMNPRGSSDGPDDERHRTLARRGQTYGRRRVDADGEFTDRPVTGVGLLFLAFAASITDQFEFVLSTWAENAAFPSAANPDGAIDPVIGQSPAAPLRLPRRWGAIDRVTVAAQEPVVRLLGGEHLFAPSIPALHRLNR